MRATVSILSVIGSLLSAAVMALPLRATSNLLENSPFLPGNVAAAGPGQGSAPLELRSILREGDEYEFSLYDAAKKQSTWAHVNEAGHDFTVKAYDPDKQVVTIEQKNQIYKLTLKESKIALLAVAPGPQPGIAGAPVAGQGTFPPRPEGGPFPPGIVRGPGGNAPSLTPEQLRNLEADINRRRELRRQATAAQPPAPMPPPQPGQTRP